MLINVNVNDSTSVCFLTCTSHLPLKSSIVSSSSTSSRLNSCPTRFRLHCRRHQIIPIQAVSTTPFPSDNPNPDDRNNSDNSEQPETDDDDEGSQTPTTAQTLLEQLESPEFDDQLSVSSQTEIGQRIFQSRGIIDFLSNYLTSGLTKDFDEYLDPPYRLVCIAAISLLFGFFAATSATTIIGSVADWDPLAAAVLLILTEGFTKYYYTRPYNSRLVQLINAFKIGLIYGMVVDSFKLCT